MKKLLITCVLFCFVLSSCEIPTTTKKKKTPLRTALSKKSTQQPAPLGVGGVLGGNETGILVNADWMKRYKEKESKYGTIPADDLIWKEGENYRVNDDVVNHFSEMKIAGSTPQKKEP